MLLLDFFMAVFFIAGVSEAQLVPMYTPQLYNVPSYVNMGINSYTQTRKLAKAANRLGVPTIPPKTLTKIATDIGVPLALQAPTLARLGNGIPLLPKAPGLAGTAGLVGMPLSPKAFPGRLPMLPQIQPPKLPGVKLNPLPSAAMLLQSSPLMKRESQLQTRSTGNIKNVEKAKSESSIDPVGQTTDGRDRGVLGTPISYENNYPKFHSARIRSPGLETSTEDLDYLTKAANPVDDLKPKIGKMVNKMKQEFKHARDKVDKSFRGDAKEATNEDEDSAPYTVWVKDPADGKHDLTESVKEKLAKASPKDSDGDKENAEDQQEQNRAVIDGMDKYVKIKTNRDSGSIQERMPANFASDLRKTMDEFQKSMAQSSLMHKAKSTSQDSDEKPQRSRPQDEERKSSEERQSKDSSNPASGDKEDSDSKQKNQLPKNNSGNGRRTDSEKEKSRNATKNTQKSNNQSKANNDYVNNMKNSGKSNAEKGNPIDEKPLNNFWEKASVLAKSISDAHQDSDKTDTDPKVGTVHHHFYGGFPPNNNLYPGYSSNDYQNYGIASYCPYYSGLMEAYYPYQSSRPIWNSAIDLAQSIVDHEHHSRYYKRSPQVQSQTGAVAGNRPSYSGTSQTTGQQNARSDGRVQSAQKISPAAVQMAQGIMGGNYQHIANSAVGLGTAIAGTTRAGYNSGRFVKRSNQADTIYNPSIGLADSIYTVASDPRQIDSVRVLDSIGRIWTPAVNLAQNIQNMSPKVSQNGSTQSTESVKSDKKSNASESAPKKPLTADSADDAAKTNLKTESGKQKGEKAIETNSQTDSTPNEGGTTKPAPASPASVVKAATDLAQKITTLAIDPTSYQHNPTGGIWDPALDMSSQIVGSVMNPGMYQNAYVPQTIPSHVSGYYPRNIQPSVFPAGSLWSPFVGGNSGLTYSLTQNK